MALELKNTEFNAQGVELNQRYASAAVLPDADGGPETWARDPQLYLQATTRPGAKLPHVWLVNRHGRRVSTLDVVGRGKMSLVTGHAGVAWVRAAERLNRTFLRTVVIGSDDAQDLYGNWARAREIAEAGALLVRPDGYIAWRCKHAVWDDDAAYEALSSAVANVLALESEHALHGAEVIGA